MKSDMGPVSKTYTAVGPFHGRRFLYIIHTVFKIVGFGHMCF